LEIVCAEAALT